ncbi:MULTISPECIES: DegT/DnrJ/EryC1/StrS family aminotransferase [unclassified Microbacterium]|uniref:DegT/DnrJ/EryC1/StrS family aminotransferase n=1 Tax=unclassified Microbacterium TaxID=2609290 RepID=UPI0004936B9B|nr:MULTISPECIES: DegT/DnrJ/EryC1/StrS family aminotransferase [unclassified Microbacterium]MCV0333171.1 DegT/DnrJ/EryC1/StrS family aminotransferase [Microbacterium sp.]MCV0375616.1 DegT/DnrJ/EryC1/StrS family aminotransferase [Microbacterium sp.]MCV0389029.1 DegT/DnrJ/EryC1/StrS family aminotransferase [Microbacterium sp.]MCV0417557.1 DegT/DnrJ/EryC1/StrS family aminotransferase [Microbacterium sp.]MCV0420868.1 DegT/DnrJ/EryC1/StrS family aminotransferase [Microbacterium sp.]
MTEFIPAAKPLIGDEERAAVDRVLLSGMVAQGPEVAAFESEFSDHFVEGLPVIAVNSGTSGLHLGLLAAGVGPGDEVIVPSFTFAATANAVALTGATPVFADIEPETFTLDPAAVDAAVTDRTRGILPVHLYGHPARMNELVEIAQRRGLALYEDAAQAHGAALNGRPVGTFGTMTMFSLYPTKNMTSGEGGMVVTADEETARRVRLLRNQGMERQYENELIGFNARMTDIHAAIGRVQLTKVDAWTETRRSNAAFLDANLEGVTVPPIAEGARHVYHQYTIRVEDDRDGFVKALREEHSIGSGVYYPIPNHRLPSLEQYAPGLDLPQTERAAREAVSLPVHPSLSAVDLERIIAAVNALAGAGS